MLVLVEEHVLIFCELYDVDNERLCERFRDAGWGLGGVVGGGK
jgi:hypothetical protein